MHQQELYKADLQKINFWKRLELFVKNVQVVDPISEEEKEMILKICKIPELKEKQEISFKMPTDKQLVDIAILFSQDKGVINKTELTNMVAMSEFILNRLYENKDVMIPATIESES